MVVSGHWVDDFPVVELEANASAAEFFVDRFFALLGWPIKAPSSFSRVFDPLGVRLDLGMIVDGMILVENKAGRMEELRIEIEAIVRNGTTSPAVARVMRGRLLFARSQAFGRLGAPALRAIGRVADFQSPAPYRLGRSMLTRVSGLLGKHLDTRGYLG
jgi:hypothetical protein